MKKVVLGMSGGVDSSVAAILLQKEGYEVIGVTFRLIDDFSDDDAAKVCKKLGIKHHIIDYRKEFNKEVINRFINDYKSGITPNPCILCNRQIKFNFLYEAMKKLKCDYIATGHYAKIIDKKLYKSEELNKDQTYFLCQVTKEQLSKVLFPLEGISKDIVRKIAKEYGLENALKKDSTDVCFIKESFKEYISNEIKEKKGPIINIKTNEIIGEHIGLSNYTIGQRKGLNIGGMSNRIFVANKDIINNILYICDDDKYLTSTSCIIDNVNWIGEEKIKKCTAKFRYHQQDNPVELEWLNNNEILVKYPQGVKSVTPGQFCVFYEDDLCLGGGIIKQIIDNNNQ